jgi:hypothetical protein
MTTVTPTLQDEKVERMRKDIDIELVRDAAKIRSQRLRFIIRHTIPTLLNG